MARSKSAGYKDSSANIGFEANLWLAVDKLRNNMDAAEYKHVVLGLIFLKYISDTFEEHHAKLVAGKGDYKGANPEDQDEYKAENVFGVPPAARWTYLQASAKQPTIGKIVNDAMVAIVRDNPRLKGVLPKDYARPGLDKHRLGELIDLIAASDGVTVKTHLSVDLLGRVYEYFLTRFASAEGKNGGMFVQSEKFIESHGGKLGGISIYGQESNATTRRLAVMNLALRGIEADFGPEHADSKQNFRPIRAVLPPKELMASFTAKVAPLYAQITANLHQSHILATLRDTLLPKLLSGELSPTTKN